MEHTFLNLRRSDISREYGGINDVVPMEEWGSYVMQNIQKKLRAYGAEDVEPVIYFPKAHLIPVVKTPCEDSPVKTGHQGVYRDDAAENGNSGAFTTNRTADMVKAMGCGSVTIGHCEERRDKAGILRGTGITDEGAVGGLLNQEIKAVIRADLIVPYCIGEMDGGQEQWQEVLKSQLGTGPEDVDKEEVVTACEPIWVIGPDKTPPDETHTTKTGSCIKEMAGGVDMAYGGGLKTDNTRMLVSVPVMDGSLATLARLRGRIGFYSEEYLGTVRIYLERD